LDDDGWAEALRVVDELAGDADPTVLDRLEAAEAILARVETPDLVGDRALVFVLEVRGRHRAGDVLAESSGLWRRPRGAEVSPVSMSTGTPASLPGVYTVTATFAFQAATSSVGQPAPAGLLPPVCEYRHHALNWLTNAPIGWDEVDTST
jgi:hypothetical protein